MPQPGPADGLQTFRKVFHSKQEQSEAPAYDCNNAQHGEYYTKSCGADKYGIIRGMVDGAWAGKEAAPGLTEALETAGYGRLMAKLLAVRGVDASTAESFLSPSMKGLAAAATLPGVSRAAERMRRNIRAGGKTVVFGDYDCDGICATAILCRTISALGGVAAPFIPERLSEGYGMTEESVSRMLAAHGDAKLVVTVDNGINAVDQIERLARLGIETIVTDHHLPGEELPCCTVVNPKVSSGAGQDGLCGAGVAFFVANELVRQLREAGEYAGGSIAGPLLVLAGIATVTDIMPLTGQNRIIVAEALRYFPKYAPVGVKELMERAARTGMSKPTSRDFGFLIGPRINAAGRMGDGLDALELVMEESRETARRLAWRVDLANTERKNVEKEMTDKAMELVVPGAAAQVVDMPDGHPGVAGIVAARLLDRLNSGEGPRPSRPVPVCVVIRGKGSARGPAGLNVRDALAACGDCLERFGGHSAAAGFTLRPGMVDEFRRRFAAACAAQAEAAGESALAPPAIDAWIDWSDVTLEFADEIARLEPFGEANPEPVFAIRGAVFSSLRKFGRDKNGAEGCHLQAEFAGGPKPHAVWWGAGRMADVLGKDKSRPRDVMFTIAVSDWLERHAEMRILAVRDTPAV